MNDINISRRPTFIYLYSYYENDTIMAKTQSPIFRKPIDLSGVAYMSGHNLVFTIPKDVAEMMSIKPGDRIKVRLKK